MFCTIRLNTTKTAAIMTILCFLLMYLSERTAADSPARLMIRGSSTADSITVKPNMIYYYSPWEICIFVTAIWSPVIAAYISGTSMLTVRTSFIKIPAFSVSVVT